MRLLDLYKVETLDSRFTSKTGEPLPNASPSRWNTPEYYVYYAFFLTIPFLMFKSVYDVSKPEHPGYSKFEGLLEDGWIPGRKVDNSDAQYRGFRDNVPYMAIVLILHPLLRRLYERLASGGADQQSEKAAADIRLQRRITFDLTFATIFITALHGVSALKIVLILWLNYQIATALPKQYVAAATWTFNIALLFANELAGGYRFADVAALILPPQTTDAGAKRDSGVGEWIDSYGGLIPRWEVLFNITVLRLIAFNMDYLWSLDRRASSPIEKKNLDPAALSERDRVSIGAYPSDYTFRNYLAYILYSPLYLTGPIINFNDYISQCRHTLPSISPSRIIPYFIRLLICLLTMELVLHFLYAVAISKSQPDWSTYTPFQLSMLGYFNLHIIWLKLLIPWRFFRLWSLVDGIDPPENMVRCMSDNYSVLAFWRGWHRSFNRWIVRYIYVPLGGSQSDSKVRAVANSAVVFTFVALWHDINLRLLIWGWLVVIFVLPDILARMTFPAKKWKNKPNQYRWLAGVGAVCNILMLMAANLVGFAVGLDGLKGLVNGIIDSLGGRLFLLAACVTLFVGAQVMFEWREGEKRRGVDMKC
ncbi:glycerol transporter [Elasticomyces elasticus]|uniref:Glycerol transporter n=1 Tax=Elasticomyces elasticus TaxID=574655 RepID=A0AAN8A305_9PEZI|nr:glycerol transporter [Elasticomyces elasticus]KAK4969497.1 glycerol transporter [Elasticomyces elasticus]KAK5699968.1 glycerol transporter [Elasticomyces elasticus]KAK5716693.1 glycerol transporter [Elasticomyces elasticus]